MPPLAALPTRCSFDNVIGSLPPRFIDVRRLGEGSEGGAWVARDADVGAREVVLKHVPATRRAHVRRAFDVLRRVASPHLPEVLELLPADDGGAWLVTAWVEGASLGLGPVPLDQALAEALALTHALRAIHAVGTHHGDVSLGNIVITPAAELALIDFGQIGCVGSGTPGFLAPEVLGGGGGPAGDVFALGCVLAARLFGAVPWRSPVELAALSGGSRSVVRARIDELAAQALEPPGGRLLALFEHLLDPDPEGRVSDLGALLQRLEEIRQGRGGESTWWLPARWPYRGLELGSRVRALVEGRPRLVAIAGPKGAGRGRIVEELIQYLQIEVSARVSARLCTPERLAGIFGGDEGGWLAAWMASVGERQVVGVAQAPLWSGELGESGDLERQARLQAAVLRAGAGAAASTLILPVSSMLGDLLASRKGADDASIAVIRLRPWDAEEIGEAVVSTFESAGDHELESAWSDALLEATGGWPARVVRLISALARGRIVRPSAKTLSRLATAEVTLDPLIARELLTIAWHEGRRPLPIPPTLRGLFASDGEPLAGALAVAERILGEEAPRLAERIIAERRRRRAPISLAVAVAARDRQAIESWLGEAPALLPEDPAIDRLVVAAIEVSMQARERIVRHLLRRGDAAAALEYLRAGAPGEGLAAGGCLLEARALEQLGRPAEALEVLLPLISSGSSGSSQPEDIATAQGLRWRALVDLGQAGEAYTEAQGWLGIVEGGALGVAEALTWGALAALYTGDEVRARAWLDRAEERLETCEQGAGLRARVEQLRGNMAHSRGDLAIAEAAYGRAAELFESAGEPSGRIWLRANLAGLAVETGAIAQGIAAGRRALRGLLARGQLQALDGVAVNLGQLLLRVGADDEVARLGRLLGEVAGGPLASARLSRLRADRARARASAGSRGEIEHLYVSCAGALVAASAPREASDAYVQAAASARFGRRFGAAEAHLVAARGLIEGTDAGSVEASLAVEIEALAVAAGGGDRDAFERAAEALRALQSAEELVARGHLERAWNYDVTLLAALVARGLGEPGIKRSLLARARSTAEKIMDKVEPLDRPAVRNALGREVDPSLEGLLADLDPEGGERPHERAAREGAGYHQRLIQIYRRLAREDDMHRLLAQVVDAIMELCDAERGVAVLLPWREGQPRIEVVRELASGSEGASFSRSIIDRVLAVGEPILSVDAATDDRFDGSRSVSHLHMRSVLGIPLFSRGELVGAAYVDHRLRRGAFGERDLALVEELAALASLAIVHARTLTMQREQGEVLAEQGQELARLLEERELEVRGLREQVRGEQAVERPIYRGMVGASAAMQAVFRLIDRVADADVPVVIYGESGTGKELVARAIHDAGSRRRRPFIAENCGAIPESLLESVLFGHARGAFTGAHKASAGLFEAAHGGTIFLDEVGEMSPSMQTKLLRVLQEGEVRRVGESSSRKIDVRVIAASNKDLDVMVADGSFRGDLYYRIQVVKLSIPPLRERMEDLAPLLEHFLARYDRERRLTIPAATMRLLARYPWPGNVRELENEVQRLAVLAEDRVEARDLSPKISDHGSAKSTLDPDDLRLRPRLERLEREVIGRALERCDNNQTRAAELLGLSRYGLQKKLKRMAESEADEPSEKKSKRRTKPGAKRK